MASPKMFAEVVIAGSYRNLSKATRGASGEMNTLASKTKKTSALMKSALAGIGFGVIAGQLIGMAKAADEDRRSMALLNRQLDNSWKATDQTKKSVDDFIGSMATLSGIADDELRPAYANIARQTKDMQKANKMFALAMDIAADKGVSLEVATKAVAKAMAGNEKAFNKLYPAAEKSGNAIDYVTKKSKGMAKVAGDNSPFARMTQQFDEMKETLGKQLLPYVDKLAKWMASKEGQRTIKETTKQLSELIKEALKLAKFALDNKEIIIAFGVALKGWQITSGVINSWKTLSSIWKGMKAPKIPTGGVGVPQGPTMPGKSVPKAPTAAIGLTSILAGAGATIVALKAASYEGEKGKANVLADIARAQEEYGKYYSATELLLATGKKVQADISAGGSNMFSMPTPVVNVKVDPINGKQVVSLLKVAGSQKGQTILKLLGG